MTWYDEDGLFINEAEGESKAFMVEYGDEIKEETNKEKEFAEDTSGNEDEHVYASQVMGENTLRKRRSCNHLNKAAGTQHSQIEPEKERTKTGKKCKRKRSDSVAENSARQQMKQLEAAKSIEDVQWDQFLKELQTDKRIVNPLDNRTNLMDHSKSPSSSVPTFASISIVPSTSTFTVQSNTSPQLSLQSTLSTTEPSPTLGKLPAPLTTSTASTLRPISIKSVQQLNSYTPLSSSTVVSSFAVPRPPTQPSQQCCHECKHCGEKFNIKVENKLDQILGLLETGVMPGNHAPNTLFGLKVVDEKVKLSTGIMCLAECWHTMNTCDKQWVWMQAILRGCFGEDCKFYRVRPLLTICKPFTREFLDTAKRYYTDFFSRRERELEKHLDIFPADLDSQHQLKYIMEHRAEMLAQAPKGLSDASDALYRLWRNDQKARGAELPTPERRAPKPKEKKAKGPQSKKVLIIPTSRKPRTPRVSKGNAPPSNTPPNGSLSSDPTLVVATPSSCIQLVRGDDTPCSSGYNVHVLPRQLVDQQTSICAGVTTDTVLLPRSRSEGLLGRPESPSQIVSLADSQALAQAQLGSSSPTLTTLQPVSLLALPENNRKVFTSDSDSESNCYTPSGIDDDAYSNKSQGGF